MPEFVLEVGCEELPATFVRKAYTDLADGLELALRDAGLLSSESEIHKLGTPRRLIVGVSGIISRQEDSVKEMRGPSLKAAFDDAGQPTGALQGFCRGNGVDVASIRKDDQYVWVDKPVPGRSAAEILAEVVPAAIRALTFDKTMRWGGGRMRFARPIRWILAALDGQVVPFDVEGVQSGSESRGHRFYNSETFQATSYEGLLRVLRERFVEPDPEVRRQRILEEASQVAQGDPELPEALVEENTFLTEWPTAVQGHFRPEFQVLPDSVLITAMAKHEKMFPVKVEGKLTNQFVFIRNSGEDDTVRRGNEWVLNARFNDAKFFFDEDSKHSIEDFLAKTEQIVFQEKLGTVRARADRLANLSATVAGALGGDQEAQDLARSAGRLAKADLATGLVSGLASLQGVIGGEYASRAGSAIEVCGAIASQYDIDKATSLTATSLIVADQLDKLAGYLGLGLAPTGSSDPFGLRRAATILIEAAWRWAEAFPPYSGLLDSAVAEYAKQGHQLDGTGAQQSLGDIFASRYAALLPFRHDVLEAATLASVAQEVTSPRKVRLRAGILYNLVGDESLLQACTRPLNIVSAAVKKGVDFKRLASATDLQPADLQSAEGERLLQRLADQEQRLASAVSNEDSDLVVNMVRSLKDPINEFFDTTMIMVEDPQVRGARLSLLELTTRQILAIGDVSQLEG